MFAQLHCGPANWPCIVVVGIARQWATIYRAIRAFLNVEQAIAREVGPGILTIRAEWTPGARPSSAAKIIFIEVSQAATISVDLPPAEIVSYILSGGILRAGHKH